MYRISLAKHFSGAGIKCPGRRLLESENHPFPGVVMEEMLEDPFTQTLNDLAYQLFALALIESLPETHLDKR